MKAIAKLISKYAKSGTNAAWKAQTKIRKSGAKMKQKLSQSDQKVFRNANDQDEFYQAKKLKEKKHVANRSKQATRLIDGKKRIEKTKPKKTSNKKAVVGTVTGVTTGYVMGKNTEKKPVAKQVINRAKSASKKK